MVRDRRSPAYEAGEDNRAPLLPSAAGGMRALTVRIKSPVPVHSGASGLVVLVPPDGVEPPAVRLGGACSIRLSYEGNAYAGRESNPRPSD